MYLDPDKRLGISEARNEQKHGRGCKLMIRFDKKKMDGKLKLWMEFIKSAEEKSARIQYAATQKSEKNS